MSYLRTDVVGAMDNKQGTHKKSERREDPSAVDIQRAFSECSVYMYMKALKQ